jgi:pimeloyl-CoA synthetase
LCWGNTLAYFTGASMAKKESFTRVTAGRKNSTEIELGSVFNKSLKK